MKLYRTPFGFWVDLSMILAISDAKKGMMQKVFKASESAFFTITYIKPFEIDPGHTELLYEKLYMGEKQLDEMQIKVNDIKSEWDKHKMYYL